jgi:hypothetical protein
VLGRLLLDIGSQQQQAIQTGWVRYKTALLLSDELER